jgi:Fic family protein
MYNYTCYEIMKFQLEKPDLSKAKKDEIAKAFSDEKKTEILDFVKKATDLEYLYWDVLKYKEPAPIEISKETLWLVVKIFREQKSLKTVIQDKDEKFFSWSKMDYFEEFLHTIDMNTGGEIFIGSSDFSKSKRQKLIARGIIEEAIASSQLEGAATSRQVAKKMIQEGRKPVNRSEQMILNNYASLKLVEEKYKDQKMSIDLLLELHGLITKDTLDSQNEKPRLRKNGEPIVVSDKSTGDIYHEGPDMDFVNRELKKMIAFANDELGSETFIHPVVRAIMIHFWMGYLHPFTDGNGRLARLLFYWYLTKKGYWAFAYLPISKIIKKSPVQYIMAYVYTEQDDNDLTYFIDYNFKKIKLALADFIEYLENQSKDNLQMKKKCEEKYDLNMRQVQLLQYLYGDPDERTSLMAHMNINQISRMTANRDLQDLFKKGFLTSRRQGKFMHYYGTDKIKELF